MASKPLSKTRLELTRHRQVRWVKVVGHAHDRFNRECDRLARRAAKAAQGRL